MTKRSIAKKCSVKGCERDFYGRSFCKYHYQKERNNGGLKPLPKIDPISHFWLRVHTTADDTECWLWKGCTNGRGYGQYRVNGKCWATHRYAWTVSYGRIADGLCILHKCDNPPCCNPKHLALGTQQENMQDKQIKGRQLFGKHVNVAKLDDVMALQIFQRLDSGESPHQIAKTTPICASTIYSMKKGVTWQHLRQ